MCSSYGWYSCKCRCNDIAPVPDPAASPPMCNAQSDLTEATSSQLDKLLPRSAAGVHHATHLAIRAVLQARLGLLQLLHVLQATHTAATVTGCAQLSCHLMSTAGTLHACYSVTYQLAVNQQRNRAYMHAFKLHSLRCCTPAATHL
jgi:hypothetical protein